MGHFKFERGTAVLDICQKPLELIARGCSASILDRVTLVLKTICICEARLSEEAVMTSKCPMKFHVEQEMSSNVQSDSKV